MPSTGRLRYFLALVYKAGLLGTRGTKTGYARGPWCPNLSTGSTFGRAIGPRQHREEVRQAARYADGQREHRHVGQRHQARSDQEKGVVRHLGSFPSR
jgi:hypothetical protein